MLSQGGLGGARPASPNTVTSTQQHQPLMSTSSQDTEISNAKVDEMDQQQSLSDDAATDSVQNVSLSKNAANEEDPKVAYESDMQSGSLGVISRRSLSDLGAIGDNLTGLEVAIMSSNTISRCLRMPSTNFPIPVNEHRATLLDEM
nr:hypothetical protein [Tanacetum cinerariifolium]